MINDDHLAMLAGSGISLEHAELRGYRTITDRRELASLPIHTGETVKIVSTGRRVPGLLIPLLGIDGEIRSYQFRADNPRLDDDGRVIKYESVWQQPPVLDVPPGVGAMLTDPDVPVWFTEGSRKADAAYLVGLCCVSVAGVWGWMAKNTAGASMALQEFLRIPWKGSGGRRQVVLAFDGDVARKPSVQKAMHALAQHLSYRGARVEYLWLPDTDPKTGLDDFLAAGHNVEDLWQLVRPTKPPPAQPKSTDKPPSPPPDPHPIILPVSLATLHERFRYWFGEHYDLDAIDATLAAAAVEQLDGDPLWLLLVSGPGAAKTETIASLRDCPGADVVSTITSPGALLSATAKRERTADATGGLLRKLEPRGLMVLKDVTSILSLNPGIRAEVLAAMREIYDGYWARNVGTDGGRTLRWRGRIAVVGAVTTEWDRAHAAIAAMGDRFTLLRIDSTSNRVASGRRTLGNTGDEDKMRDELARLAAGVIAGIDTSVTGKLADDELDAILQAADLVTLTRTAVDVNYRGDVIDAHAPEMPTRFARQLAQLFRGAVAIGIERPDAQRLAIRCARDSMPPLRLAIIDDLAAHPYSTPTDVRRRLDKPRATVDRALQALHILGVVDLEEINMPGAFGATQTQWQYSLRDGITPAVLDPVTVTRNITTHTQGHKEGVQPDARQSDQEGIALPMPTDISGNGQPGYKPPILVTGPDRCEYCGCHVPTQGHRDDCPKLARRC